jgi:hypothetical protein
MTDPNAGKSRALLTPPAFDPWFVYAMMCWQWPAQIADIIAGVRLLRQAWGNDPDQ